MSGRATGRARGRAPAGTGDSPTSSASPTDSGSPTPVSGTNRGRGGYSNAPAHTRPENTTATTGEGGREVGLFANYFRIETDDKMKVWDYRVDFNPEIESVKVRRLLVQHLNLFRNAAGQPSFLFDGKSNLKAMTMLDEHNLRTTHPVPPIPGGPETLIEVIFQRTPAPVEWGSFEMMRLYNTQMRRNFQHLGWLLIYRDYYDPATRISMQQYGIDVMLGLTTAINAHEGGILLACDSINKIIRHDTVLQVMRQVMQRGGGQDGVRRELGGSIVMTSYNNRTYKVDDIDFGQNPMSTFERRGRGQVTFWDYYKEQYNMAIVDKGQPLLICLPSIRDKRAAEQRGQEATTHLLIPELCVMTGLSESLRNDFNLKKQLTQSTQLPPQERFNQLRGFRNKLVANADIQRDMANWSLNFSPNLVELTGRVLPNESLMMNGPLIPIQNPGDFSKEMRSVKMLDAKPWTKWAILFPPRCADVIKPFMDAFQKVSGPLGLTLGAPRTKPLSDDRVPTFLTALTELGITPDVMVVCVLPNNNKDRYDAIKKRTCIETPCASQCILSKTLSKQNQLMSVATKICLQMACKFGSSPWAIPIPAKNSMVIGVDTYHDGSRKGESVGAFVASMNDELTRYFSRISYHKTKDELCSSMAAHLRQALDAYQTQNKRLPTRVIIYRDGVGEGMINHVFTVELKEMQNVLLATGGGSIDIKLAFIIVTKRINTKFFYKNEQTRRLDNPQPGTVVDTVVTRPERLEFFLVAQSVRAGTVAPTSFNIICNEVGWQPKHFQMLSYKLCHMYYNWPGTIRVPAPCQYAHKLAFLTGTSLHREPHQALCERLFFL